MPTGWAGAGIRRIMLAMTWCSPMLAMAGSWYRLLRVDCCAKRRQWLCSTLAALSCRRHKRAQFLWTVRNGKAHSVRSKMYSLSMASQARLARNCSCGSVFPAISLMSTMPARVVCTARIWWEWGSVPGGVHAMQVRGPQMLHQCSPQCVVGRASPAVRRVPTRWPR
jgi:hypothetical protein